jgi:hypothetical protein
MSGVSQDADRAGPSPAPDHAARLARAFATLARLEVEAAAADHASRLRELRRELTRLAAGAVALLLATGLLSVAVVWALATAIPSWAAALIVGAGLLALAGALVVPAARDLRRAVHGSWPGADRAGALANAEDDVRTSAEALLEALAHRVAHEEEHRLEHAGEHALETVRQELADEARTFELGAEELESETETALGELVEIVSLPGRAGLDALRRLIRQ